MVNPTQIKVRFSDIDMMGHVNNAVYLNYFETARMDYFEQLLGEKWNWQRDGIILLKNEVEYKKPVLLEHKPVVVINVESIGNKSFTLGYLLKVDDEVYCQGNSVLVAFNYEKNVAQEIPLRMKEILTRLKGNNN